MRCQSLPNACVYGRSHQNGFLFERRGSAMRQLSFARGRTALKRRLDEDDDQHPNGLDSPPAYGDDLGGRVLGGLKRMRVTSPPTSSPSSPEPTDTNDIAMDDDTIESSQHTDDKAIVCVPTSSSTKQWINSAKSIAVKYKLPAYDSTSLEHPTNPMCNALVVFDPHRHLAIERSPRIELIDSDDEHGDAQAKGAGHASDEEDFVRFEEIHDDDDAQPFDAEDMELE
ncbi:hypothetical protein PINS_up010765 [Pythium insidiosum]|nr:hypothetical protein PINS_up010765 [Pythium insidiosum]